MIDGLSPHASAVPFAAIWQRRQVGQWPSGVRHCLSDFQVTGSSPSPDEISGARDSESHGQ
jgi:hypothetical protein